MDKSKRIIEQFWGTASIDADSRRIFLDENGTVVSWNRGAQILNGYTSSEILGQHISIFYLPEDRQAGIPQKLLNEAREKGSISHIGKRIRKNGTIFPGHIEITSIKDFSGAVIGFSKLTRHMSEETDHWSFSFDKDGILQLTAKDLPIKAKQVSEFRNQIFGCMYAPQSVCSICDFRSIAVTDENIVLYKPGVSKYYKAIAYISNQQLDFINERLSDHVPHEIPVAVFPCPVAAKEWIAQYA